MTLHIAIAGAAGRMGRALAQAARETDDVRVVGGTERAGSRALSEAGPEFPVVAEPAFAAVGADVWIDFTTPASTLAALDSLKDMPLKAVVIGTTGLSPDDEARIAAHAGRLAIVKAGNFSLGVNLLTALVEQAAKRLGPDWDIEISETHHRRKVDAPSGTALMIGEAAARGRGATLSDLKAAPYDGPESPREAGRIGFAVSRGGGVIGDHEARLISESEILSIGHRAIDRIVFARGALHAARWAVGRPPALYSMRDVLEI